MVTFVAETLCFNLATFYYEIFFLNLHYQRIEVCIIYCHVSFSRPFKKLLWAFQKFSRWKRKKKNFP